MTELRFIDCNEMLRELGYAPAAIRAGRDGPVGPWRVMQLDYATHARDDDHVGVLCTVPPARGAAPWAITNAADTWLAAVSIRAADEAVRAEVEAVLTRYHAGPVRVDDDGTRTFVFRTSDRLPQAQSVVGDDYARIEQGCIVLDGDWPNGDLINTLRADLPELTTDGARELVAAVEAVFLKHAPPPPVWTAPPKPPAPADIKLERGNHMALCVALNENGFYSLTTTYGDEPTRGAIQRGADPDDTPPAVALYLRAPSDRGITFGTTVDYRHTYLISVTVEAGPKIADEVEAMMARYTATGTPLVRDLGDGSAMYVFAHDIGRAEPFPPLTIARGRRDARMVDVVGTRVSVEIKSKEGVVPVLAATGEWRDGVTPLTVRRSELPTLDRNGAQAILNAVEKLAELPHKPAGIVERARRKKAGRKK